MSACALAQEPAPSDPPSKTATIYVYRFRDAYAMLLKPSVFCDGKQLLRMRNGRFGKFEIPAGSHNLTSTYEGNGVSLDAKAGETYYLRVEMSKPAMFHNSRGQVSQVLEGQGKFEVGQLKPADPEDLKADPVSEAKN